MIRISLAIAISGIGGRHRFVDSIIIIVNVRIPPEHTAFNCYQPKAENPHVLNISCPSPSPDHRSLPIKGQDSKIKIVQGVYGISKYPGKIGYGPEFLKPRLPYGYKRLPILILACDSICLFRYPVLLQIQRLLHRRHWRAEGLQRKSQLSS